MKASHSVLCIGEVLWDALPSGLFAGGAPFNVACHLRELGARVLFASRVGEDELGREIRRRMARSGLDDKCLQTDPRLATGFVVVDLSDLQAPRFEILAPSAWDAMEPTPELQEAAYASEAIVFGSLAQRDSRSRATIRSLWSCPARKVFDVNLRPPYDSREVVEESFAHSQIVKLNEEELTRMRGWFGLARDMREAMAELATRFQFEALCVTRGAAGAVVLQGSEFFEHPGYRIEVVDPVGSGDAFLAAWLWGLLTGAPPAAALGAANALGAYVASQGGATPHHNAEAIRLLTSGSA